MDIAVQPSADFGHKGYYAAQVVEVEVGQREGDILIDGVVGEGEELEVGIVVGQEVDIGSEESGGVHAQEVVIIDFKLAVGQGGYSGQEGE